MGESSTTAPHKQNKTTKNQPVRSTWADQCVLTLRTCTNDRAAGLAMPSRVRSLSPSACPSLEVFGHRRDICQL